MPEIHIHLDNPLPVTVAAIIEAATPPPAPAKIDGVTVVEVDGGAELKLAPELRKVLIDFGWLPPVDGE